MQGNSDRKASSQDAVDDLRTSNGEVVRRVDLDRAAGTPGRFRRADPGVAGYEGVELARAALAGDQAALDEFHELAGLTLPGVTEYVEGDAVRLVMRKVDEKVANLEVQGTPVSQHGVARAVFQATNENRNNCTLIDAPELVAWVLSPEGQTALTRRGIAIFALASAGTLTSEEAVVAARNVGVDLTCGECAAMFYTGYPSAPGHSPAHDPSCRTGILSVTAVWRRDAPPRGVRCLVTWTGSDGRARPRVNVASVSLDYDEERWFSDGEPLHNVIAWMLAPEAAEDKAML
jgi:hypothetical protein